MDYSAIIKQLNEQANEFGLAKKLSFSSYENQGILSLLDNLCPYGEVACFFDEASFVNHFGFLETIKKKGFKYQSIVEEEYATSFINVGSYLSLAEQTRAIVCFTPKAYRLTSYLGSIKSIPVVYLVDSTDILDLLNTRIPVLNGDGFDYISLELKSHIVFDFESINQNRSNQADIFGYLLSLVLSLIDYRIGGFAGVNALDSKSFNLMKQSVLRSYLVYSKPYEEQAIYLIKNFFKCKIADLSTNGELTSLSSPILASVLYGDTKVISNPELVSRLLSLYSIFTGFNEQSFLTLRNNFLDLVALRNFTGENAETLYDVIKWQKSVFEKDKESFLELFVKLKEEIKLLCKSVSSIRNTYLALGGKTDLDTQKLIDAICYSGSVYNCFNGMTLIKESGIID